MRRAIAGGRERLPRPGIERLVRAYAFIPLAGSGIVESRIASVDPAGTTIDVPRVVAPASHAVGHGDEFIGLSDRGSTGQQAGRHQMPQMATGRMTVSRLPRIHTGQGRQ